jgi:hypothetical protein
MEAMMADRPIIFSAPMIQALLAGRKTQTRRVLKPQPLHHPLHGFFLPVNKGYTFADFLPVDSPEIDACLPYAIGDRLWCREACRAEELSMPPIRRPATRKERMLLGRTHVEEYRELDGADGVRYMADDHWQKIENTREAGDRWSDLYHYRNKGKGDTGCVVPPIHMPRWASRLMLVVTDVKVERVQDISEDDAIAEGCRPFFDKANPEMMAGPNGTHHPMMPLKGPIDAFRSLWNTIHGPDAWERNDWVAAVTFTVHQCNIDQMEKANG